MSKYPIKDNQKSIFLFIIFILLEVIIFLLQKKVSISTTTEGLWFYISLLAIPLLWFSLILGLCQFFIWTHLLKKAELSKVYSMSSLSYPITMLISSIVFKENLSISVWVGGILISFGVFLIGKD